METILALGGRRSSPPRNDARQPRLVRLDQWTVVLASIISLFGLLLQARAATSLTLAWDPSGASGIAGYRLHYGTSSKSYSQTRDLGNTTTTTVSNLLPEQTYYFAVTDYNTAGVESIYSNQVSFTAANPIANGSGVAKDFDGDGKADLVWEDTVSGGRVIWTLNNGVPIPNSSIALPTASPSWHIAAVGDFLGNRQSDLVLQNTATGECVIWILNNGVLQYGIEVATFSAGWQVAGAGDFNGDGFADLVLENTNTGEHLIWLLKSGVPSSSISLPTSSPTWHIAGVGDFLGNRQSDLVLQNTVTNECVIWILSNGVLQRGIEVATFSAGWQVAGAADFNSDGQADLVLQNTISGQRIIWTLNKGVPSSSVSLPTVATQWSIVDH